jgi:hypothetical protein
MVAASPSPAGGASDRPDQVGTAGASLTFGRDPVAVAGHGLRWLVAGFLLVVVTAAVTGWGPIDYRWVATISGVVGAVMAVGLFGYGCLLSRARVRVSDVGVSPYARAGEPIPWRRIRRLRTVWHPFGRRMVVDVDQAGRLWPMPLGAPGRPLWRGGMLFEAQVAAVGEVASRHGLVVVHEPGPKRWTATVAVLGLLAVGGVAAVARGVIWPWTATLPAVADACPAVAAAGLDRYWPTSDRELVRDERDVHELGVFSYCTWTTSRPHRTSRYWRLDVVVRWHGRFVASSAVGNAISAFDAARDELRHPAPVPGLGDEAYVSAGSAGVVVARRANATVKITLSGRSTADAQHLALVLCTSVVDAMRPP